MSVELMSVAQIVALFTRVYQILVVQRHVLSMFPPISDTCDANVCGAYELKGN
jgi:hypothetical protein